MAGRVAYHQLVDSVNRLSVDTDLGRVLPLVAVALSTVAPIYKRSSAKGETTRVLAALEVEAILFRPAAASRALLDDLFIRRGDLHRAIESLRVANQYFGKKP